MYANMRTFIFTFTLIFFHFRCKQTANRLQTDCKQTANRLQKRERPKTAFPFPSVILKTKTFHQHKGKPHQLSPNHEEHTAPIIITDF